ncbi:MAG: zinc ribbon domain-containing protein [Thiogranum sp.]|nr:zinc ribbon domain-containing protein [Thiogranum sp.]
MPIYEYRCTECGHELEKLQKLNDAPLTLCPGCGKSALLKCVSAAGFRLKGGGWYETDFKNKSSQKNVASSDSTAKVDSAKKGDSTAKAGSADGGKKAVATGAKKSG